MKPQPPIPESLWNTVPPQAQDTLLAIVDSLKGRIDELEAVIRDLQARLKLNSTNSSKPPSTDPVGFKRKPPTPPSGRKRGGQPGKPQAFRALVPSEKLRSSTECKPLACRRCGHELQGEDSAPLIRQVAEIPKIEPLVKEYRLHRLTCAKCGTSTCGKVPEGVPAGCFSPYTQAVLATLTGGYRLSKRQVRQLTSDLLGLSISTGIISKLERRSAQALAEPYGELARSIHEAETVHIDETGWREEGRKAWLWVTATASATVFAIARDRSAKTAKTLLGDQKEEQVVVSDRFKSYDWKPTYWRQLCWSHLRRDFQAMIDRGGVGAAIGRRLLELSDRVFKLWHRRRDGPWENDPLRKPILWLRPSVRRALEAGTRCGCARTAGTCAEMLRVEEGLWNFVRLADVEPTNNAAERALRHAVIWRRISGGTNSESGSRFVERMLTAVATCRQQGRNVLEYLTSCFEADLKRQAIPSLLPTKAHVIKTA
jgi:transposase